MERKFNEGDLVMIRPFEEIDREEIGRIRISDKECFSIPRNHIDKQSMASEPYIVIKIDDDYGAYIYRLRKMSQIHTIDYWWAQGMLRSYEEAQELPDADNAELFDFLFEEATE